MKNGIGVFISYVLVASVLIAIGIVMSNITLKKVEIAGSYEKIIIENKRYATEGYRLLETIANLQSAYHAGLGKYSADWYEMGFAKKPNTFYYTFEIVSDGKSFVAKAILKENLGKAKAGNYITLDQSGNRAFSSPELQALIIE